MGYLNLDKRPHFCAKRLFRSSGPPGASVRPSSVRPSAQISKCPKNGPPETDLRAGIPGSRVPFLVHFGSCFGTVFGPILVPKSPKKCKMGPKRVRHGSPAGRHRILHFTEIKDIHPFGFDFDERIFIYFRIPTIYKGDP